MRIERTAITLSWIPSEAVTGVNRAVFASGFTHYDDPPPDAVDDDAQLEEMRARDAFRFANRLRAWVEVEDGKIVDAGYSGGGLMGSSTVRLAGRGATFAAVGFGDIQHEPELTETSARFVQTFGGRTALPAPRTVSRPPFVKLEAPTVWTTLALTINADGSADVDLVGASTFPRHWVYGVDGKLLAKAGLTDFKDWYRTSFGKHTPWGDVDTPALVTAVETALERELATHIMRGGEKPEIRKVKEGATLTEQGTEGDEVFLLLDGVLVAEVDGEQVAELGPGAILGERAVLEGGTRTSTLRALTKCRVAVVRADQLDRSALEEVSEGHRREESDTKDS
jgi:hypothetical protein